MSCDDCQLYDNILCGDHDANLIIRLRYQIFLHPEIRAPASGMWIHNKNVNPHIEFCCSFIHKASRTLLNM